LFHIGDKIVHPMHGAGVVENIVQKELDNEVQSFYVLNMPLAGMVIMVPIKSCKGIGVRKVIDSKQADELMHQLEDIDVDMNQNWNRRYRENMSLIKSGNPVDVARVVKGLMMRERDKGLSTGERKMLHSAKQILISELIMAKSSNYDEVEQKINKALA
jgi:CarD family transcriptional regulator